MRGCVTGEEIFREIAFYFCAGKIKRQNRPLQHLYLAHESTTVFKILTKPKQPHLVIKELP